MSNDRTWCSQECDRLDCDRNQQRLPWKGQYSFANLEGTFLCAKALDEEEERNDKRRQN